jgi:hypothetical protein
MASEKAAKVVLEVRASNRWRSDLPRKGFPFAFWVWPAPPGRPPVAFTAVDAAGGRSPGDVEVVRGYRAAAADLREWPSAAWARRLPRHLTI